MKKIDWQHIVRQALPVVAVVALLASYRDARQRCPPFSLPAPNFFRAIARTFGGEAHPAWGFFVALLSLVICRTACKDR